MKEEESPKSIYFKNEERKKIGRKKGNGQKNTLCPKYDIKCADCSRCYCRIKMFITRETDAATIEIPRVSQEKNQSRNDQEVDFSSPIGSHSLVFNSHPVLDFLDTAPSFLRLISEKLTTAKHRANDIT